MYKYKMNQFCIGMRDLEIHVPDKVINAYFDALNFLKKNNYKKSIQENWNYFSWYLQDIPEKHKTKFLHKDKNLNEILSEHFKIYNVWITECPAILTIRDFLLSHFSSCFHARIANLPSGEYVDIHPPHSWPRVFIPLHYNESDFCLIENEKLYTARFEVGSMYLFDVRKFHGTYNKSKIDRYMGTFYFDPKIETISRLEGV